MTEHNAYDIPTWWRQSSFLDFRAHYLKKKPLFFIGSGLSIGAGLPNWQDLLLQLARMHDEQAPAADPIFPSVSSALASGKADQARYLDTGSVIEKAFAKDLKTDIRQAVASLLNDETKLPKSSPTHEVIARLRWSRIITTNYDTLLERAAKAASRPNPSDEPDEDDGLEVLTTNPERDFWAAEPAESPQRRILKIHGDVTDPQSLLVLSKESFEARYSGAKDDKFTTVLRTVLRSSQLILFLGYGHGDPYIRTLFTSLLNYAVVRQNVFALIPREGEPHTFKSHVEELASQQIRVITYSPDQGHRELLDFLQYLENPAERDAQYERQLRTRRPTVVMVHCGGTIGSAATSGPDAHQHLSVVVKKSRYDSGLNEFSQRLLKWYQASYNSGEQLHIDIRWEILPPNDQMFSENATYSLWNALTSKIDEIIYKYFHAASGPDALLNDERLMALYTEERAQYAGTDQRELTEKAFRDEFSGRYILGIIVLFGTDTLAIAASALGLSLQHLPCPVILTGANQPPREENLAATRGRYYATSDAWTNLMNAIFFLQCFGHRMTEVFVCFGDTVHNVINLRKRAAEIIPTRAVLRTRRHSEPFAFRNLSQRGQYMFKLIDGLFCNNYYPNPINYELMVRDPEFQDLRHIRFDAVSPNAPKGTVSESFQARVTYVEISPCFPVIDLEGMVDAGLHAIVAQGYASGTYPSVHLHEFAHFLDMAHELAIPVVLVSRYGILPTQQEYAVAEPTADHETVLPLYQIIAETAVPLVTLVVSRIDKKDWDRRPGETKVHLLLRRKELIQQGISDLFSGRPNILSLELKNVANKAAMYNEMESMQELRARQQAQRKIEEDELLLQLESSERLAHGGPNRSHLVMYRRDLLLLLEELPHVFEKVEAAPDGLDALFNLGFDYGFRLWRSCENPRPPIPQADDDLLTDGLDLFFELHNAPVREQRQTEVTEILAAVRDAINASGIVRIDSASLKIESRVAGDGHDSGRAGGFNLVFQVERPLKSAHDERYAVMTFSEDERQFFEKLRTGPRDGDITNFDRDIRDRYNALLKKTWKHTATTFDWFVFGVLKGLAYGVATALRIDYVASRAEGDPRFLHWFRKMMKTNIRATDEHVWQIAYRYSELQASDYDLVQQYPSS